MSHHLMRWMHRSCFLESGFGCGSPGVHTVALSLLQELFRTTRPMTPSPLLTFMGLISLFSLLALKEATSASRPGRPRRMIRFHFPGSPGLGTWTLDECEKMYSPPWMRTSPQPIRSCRFAPEPDSSLGAGIPLVFHLLAAALSHCNMFSRSRSHRYLHQCGFSAESLLLSPSSNRRSPRFKAPLALCLA